MQANSDVWGWLAAFGGMLAFGSFGVPIKSEVARSVDIGELADGSSLIAFLLVVV